MGKDSTSATLALPVAGSSKTPCSAGKVSDERTRAHNDPAHDPNIAEDPVAWQLKRRRNHVRLHCPLPNFLILPPRLLSRQYVRGVLTRRTLREVSNMKVPFQTVERAARLRSAHIVLRVYLLSPTVDAMRVRNGQITEHWGVANLFSLLEQLGARSANRIPTVLTRSAPEIARQCIPAEHVARRATRPGAWT